MSVLNIPAYLMPLSGWTGYTPVIPKLYWDVYSQEERIKRLCMGVDRMEKYCDYVASTVNDVIDGVDEALAENLEETRKELAEFKSEIMQLILELNIGALQWNCQIGWYTDTVEAQRSMFNDLSVHAITVKKLNTLDMTVKELANCGLNVRGLAVMSYWLLDKYAIDNDFIYDDDVDDRLNAEQLGVAHVNENGVVYIPEEFRA